MSYRFVRIAHGWDLGAFDCGDAEHNTWLSRSALRADEDGTARVHLLVDDTAQVVGYFAIVPTLVGPESPLGSSSRGGSSPIPGQLLARLALDRSMQGHPALRWGTQLLLEALRQVVRAAEVTREHVLVVAADSERIAQWYMDHGFQPTQAADGRRLHMKVATARKQVAAYDRQFRRVSP